MTRHATITGVGSSLPLELVPNTWFEDKVETTDEWIRDRTGIEARHFADDGVVTSDLGRRGRRDSRWRRRASAPEQIDLIVCATVTGDTPFPATAVWIQQKLGIVVPGLRRERRLRGLLLRPRHRDGDRRVRRRRHRAAGRRRGVQPDPRLRRPTDVRPLRRRRRRHDRAGDATGRASSAPCSAPTAPPPRSSIMPGGGSREPATPETVAASRHRDPHAERPRGLQARGHRDGRRVPRGAREERALARRRRRADPPPGERPDHEGGRRTAPHPAGEGRARRRRGRQHERGVDPDRARPGMARRADPRGRPRPVHVVRRRPHVGRHGDALDDAGARRGRA